MIALYNLLLAWLPSGIRLVFLGLIALSLLLLVFRVMKIALDATPFL